MDCKDCKWKHPETCKACKNEELEEQLEKQREEQENQSSKIDRHWLHRN